MKNSNYWLEQLLKKLIHQALPVIEKLQPMVALIGCTHELLMIRRYQGDWERELRGK
jgi:hypothetical protein